MHRVEQAQMESASKLTHAMKPTSPDPSSDIYFVPSSSSSSSSPSSAWSCTMQRLSLKMVVIGLAWLVVYTTWQVTVPRKARDDLGRCTPLVHEQVFKATSETDTLIGSNDTPERTLANNESASEFEDSAFPFDSENGPEDDITNENNDETNEKSDITNKNNDVINAIDKVRGETRIRTFFSSLDKSFDDVTVGRDNSIPTQPFLEACINTLQLFDSMHKMILNRVVEDIRGNVRKIRVNYDMMPERSQTFQEMVHRDLAQDLQEVDGSSTLSLKWLVRAFQFISRFLTYIDAGKEQTECANLAYAETLTKYHGFVTRTLFSTAFRTLETRAEFVKDLAMDVADLSDPRFEKTAMEDLRMYNSALSVRLRVLDNFFRSLGIDQ